ncbi:hypothetical protein [Paraburkholderia caledonica]|uniref:hypothetical protein n=1 Tax=Paraburkholderia caledonica TaxID=134536 RepID=UPI00211B6231|nr:hypothetical protein [Paraburkholderia caledonica]
MDWTLLTDRLYRRYIRLDELQKARVQMDRVRQIFASYSSESAVDWRKLDAGIGNQSRLDPHQRTLAEVFSRYFEHFGNCAEAAQVNFDVFKDYPGYSYEPVRIVVSDLPRFLLEKDRPITDCDALEGPPFWLR